MLIRLWIDIATFFVQLVSRKPMFTVTIYCKSGAVIKLKNLVEFTYKKNGNDFVSIDWRVIGNTRPLTIELDDILHIIQS